MLAQDVSNLKNGRRRSLGLKVTLFSRYACYATRLGLTQCSSRRGGQRWGGGGGLGGGLVGVREGFTSVSRSSATSGQRHGVRGWGWGGVGAGVVGARVGWGNSVFWCRFCIGSHIAPWSPQTVRCQRGGLGGLNWRERPPRRQRSHNQVELSCGGEPGLRYLKGCLYASAVPAPGVDSTMTFPWKHLHNLSIWIRLVPTGRLELVIHTNRGLHPISHRCRSF